MLHSRMIPILLYGMHRHAFSLKMRHSKLVLLNEQPFIIRDTPKLTDEELDSALVALPAWRAAEDRKSITRSFVAKNFVKGARGVV